jgi:regulator of protease activity HflC (stomatin/prohibitin superfamily)
MITTTVVIVILLIIFLPQAIRIVKEYQRLVVFRLGRCIGERGPGFVILIPIVDKVNWVDLREQYLEIPSQICITKDNASISIDFLIYWRIFEPVKSVVEVRNFDGALQGIATTTLRAVIGDIPLDDVLARREEINKILRVKLDDVTERWGGKVTGLEIREIEPPDEIQTAMNRQMSAERVRRAMVLEADGQRESAIKVAEGEKQSAILKAEGKKQAQFLEAEGYSLALDKIFSVAKGIDSKTMGLQYLETLKAVGESPSTKYIFPMEFTSLLRPFVAGSKELFEREGDE